MYLSIVALGSFIVLFIFFPLFGVARLYSIWSKFTLSQFDRVLIHSMLLLFLFVMSLLCSGYCFVQCGVLVMRPNRKGSRSRHIHSTCVIFHCIWLLSVSFRGCFAVVLLSAACVEFGHPGERHWGLEKSPWRKGFAMWNVIINWVLDAIFHFMLLFLCVSILLLLCTTVGWVLAVLDPE